MQAFYSTEPTAAPEAVLKQYSERWSIEETHRACKTHLGMEQPQGFTKAAVKRTAPMALFMYSLIVLWFAQAGVHAYHPPQRPWYPDKPTPCFFDMLTTLRRGSLLAALFEAPDSPLPSQKFLHVIQIATESSA